MDDIEEEIHVLVVGKKQCGKSTTGNVLAGKKYFTTGSAYEPVTEEIECQVVTNKINHMKFVILDSPEFNSFDISDIHRFHNDVFPGFHVIAVVQSLQGQYSELERKALEEFREKLGNYMTNSVVIVFTKHDSRKVDHNTFVSFGPPDFLDMIRDFGFRYCFVDDKSDSTAKEEHARLTDAFAEMKQLKLVRLYNSENIKRMELAETKSKGKGKKRITPKHVTVSTGQYKHYEPLESKVNDAANQVFRYCKMCRRKNVLKYLCSHCGDNARICEDCYSFHRIVVALKTHRMQPLDCNFPVVALETGFTVPRHCEDSYHVQAGEFTYYCKTCNRCLCSKCNGRCRKEHNLVKLEDLKAICNHEKHRKERRARFVCEQCKELMLCKKCKSKHTSEMNDVTHMINELMVPDDINQGECHNRLHGLEGRTKYICLECDKFLCATCRTEHRTLNHTQFKVSKKIKVNCSSGLHEERKPAKFICESCDGLYLCDECKTQHGCIGSGDIRHRVKPLTNHRQCEQEVVNNTTVCGLCQTDTKGAINTFCFNCRMFVCPECFNEYKGTPLPILRHLFLDIPTLRTRLNRQTFVGMLNNTEKGQHVQQKNKLVVAAIRFSGCTIDCSVSFNTNVLCNNPPHGDVSRENTTRIFSHSGCLLVHTKQQRVFFGEDAIRKYMDFDLNNKEDWFFCDDFESYCFSLSNENEESQNKFDSIKTVVASVVEYGGRCLDNLFQSRGLLIPPNVIDWVVVLPPLDNNETTTELRESVKQCTERFSSVTYITELGLLIQLHWNSFFKRNRKNLRDKFITLIIRDNYALQSLTKFEQNGEKITIMELATEKVTSSLSEILDLCAADTNKDRLRLDVKNYLNDEFRRNTKTLTKNDVFTRSDSEGKYFKIHLEESICSCLELEFKKTYYVKEGFTLNVREKTLEVDIKVAEKYIYGPISSFILETVRKERPEKKVIIHCNLPENAILSEIVWNKLKQGRFQDGVDFYSLPTGTSLLAASVDTVVFSERLAYNVSKADDSDRSNSDASNNNCDLSLPHRNATMSE